jgi:hypothetical protein
MFFFFTVLHAPCFSTSNLLWNCYRFCKWRFISPMHLTCNGFNVHGIAHMKHHVPSMSPLHQKSNHCQIDLLLPPKEGPQTLRVFISLSSSSKIEHPMKPSMASIIPQLPAKTKHVHEIFQIFCCLHFWAFWELSLCCSVSSWIRFVLLLKTKL